MSRRLLIAFTPLLLSGCMAQLTAEEQKTACAEMPASDACRQGWAFPGQRDQIRKIQTILVEDQMTHERDLREERDRAAQEAEAAGQRAEDERRKREAAPRYVGRKTATFASYADAKLTLGPVDGMGLIGPLMNDPMSLKGAPVALYAQVVQVVDAKRLLVNPCFAAPVPACPILAVLSRGCGGPREFVNGQKVVAVAEVVGTYSYENVMGASMTVPQALVYGIGPAGL